METIIVALITSIASCITVALPIALQHRKERKTQMDELKEGLKCSLRNDILSIYNANREKKAFTMYDKQAVNYSYQIYKGYKGNSFVDDIVSEMNGWEII